MMLNRYRHKVFVVDLEIWLVEVELMSGLLAAPLSFLPAHLRNESAASLFDLYTKVSLPVP